jgi:predicted RNA-binding protein with PUA-like domain
MNYWLVKSDPETYGWPEMKKDKTTFWNGVRNHAARLNLLGMKKGDTVLFYHSNTDKAIMGIVKVAKEAYHDHTSDEERWVMVDLTYDSEFKNMVTLADMKQVPALSEIGLIRQSRLSVMPITKAEYDFIVKMGE